MNLADWITDNQITITELAHRLGCSRAAVSYWISGKTRPSPNRTRALHKITRGKVTVADLQATWERAR